MTTSTASSRACIQASARSNSGVPTILFEAGEVSKFSPKILEGLRQRGIDLKPGQGEDSGVHGVLIRDGRIDGGFDPRREGVVLTLP